MNYSDISSLYRQHLNPQFIELIETIGYQRLFVKAEGCWVWDDQGRKYLDLLAGFGSMNLGHYHPKLVQALQTAVLNQPYNFLHIGPQTSAATLAKKLCELAPQGLDRVLYSCTGAEAVEGALKIARLATGREQFVHVENSYHGTSLATLGLMGKPKKKSIFGSLTPLGIEIPHNDLEALEKVLKKKRVAAFIVEPILGEGGVQIPPNDYLDRALDLCHDYGALLIVDEIQTALGRTGHFFYTRLMQKAPDIVTIGKSLSGGLIPISATLTRSDLYHKAFSSASRFDLHNSTFAGSALGCAVANETLQQLQQLNLCQSSTDKGKYFLSQLRTHLKGHPLVIDVSGEGLLLRIELGPTDQTFLGRWASGLVRKSAEMAVGQWLSLRLLENGVILQPSAHRWDVLKINPPLTITTEDIDYAVQKIALVFQESKSLGPLFFDLGKRLISKTNPMEVE